MLNFDLRFSESEINMWTNEYSYIPEDGPLAAKEYARENLSLSKQMLYRICSWKSHRRASEVDKNTDLSVTEITGFSFTTPDEYSRISSLTLLKGVSWPTASVILHYCVDDTYPILDQRAIWSLGEEKPSYYTFEFWWQYVEICREISKRNNISVRQLDKALWKYSKEKQ